MKPYFKKVLSPVEIQRKRFFSPVANMRHGLELVFYPDDKINLQNARIRKTVDERKSRNSVSNVNNTQSKIEKHKKLRQNSFFQMLQQRDHFKDKVLSTIEDRNGLLSNLRITEQQLNDHALRFQNENKRIKILDDPKSIAKYNKQKTKNELIK